MKRVEFRLTMPNVGSWNGKWSGEGRNYTIVKNIADKWAKELGLTDETPTNSWHYHWNDGWTARITARIVPKGERLKKSWLLWLRLDGSKYFTLWFAIW